MLLENSITSLTAGVKPREKDSQTCWLVHSGPETGDVFRGHAWWTGAPIVEFTAFVTTLDVMLLIPSVFTSDRYCPWS